MNKILNFKIILTALILVFLLLVLSQGVFAREVCYTQYGGGETCINVEDNANIDVDKKVSSIDGNYVNHLSSSVHMFGAEDEIFFKIIVKNTGEVDLKNVYVKDVLPNFVSFNRVLSGSVSSSEGNKITFSLGSLAVGEEKEIKFKAKVVEDSQLPKDDKVCLTNVASVKGKRSDNNEEQSDVDYSNFCINLPQVLGEAPKELPKAGVSEWFTGFGALLSSLGLLLKKRLNR